MPESIEAFPWRRDKKLFDERDRILSLPKGRMYENWAIFCFGMHHLGKLPPEDLKQIDLVFRAPTEFPDAILLNDKTKEGLNVEFEEFSSGFKEDVKKHDYRKCDLVVCILHNWKKCPVDVYELTTGKLYKASKPSS